jgi:phosphatidylserine/phosphatidylglycerophosphate/cardiolipin synthase-like enzyme
MLFWIFIGALLGVALLPYLLFRQNELPPGTDLSSPGFQFSEARLLVDHTAWDAERAAYVQSHVIFDTILEEIEAAETFIVADFFLWNPWRGAIEGSGQLRPLAEELANALISKRIENPSMPILVITDPINRIYGDLAPGFYERMAAANIPVIFTDLAQLPDSNRLYAPQAVFWSQYLPGGEKRLVPNPFDGGGEKLTLSQLGRLLLFKANHRKVLITGYHDAAARLLMGSFNPADGSANHSNLAVLVDGAVAIFAAHSELQVAEWSSADSEQVQGGRGLAAAEAIAAIRGRLPRAAALPAAAVDESSVAYRSEGAIRDELVLQLNRSGSGDRIDAGIFYFSDRRVVGALKEAVARGAKVRLLMDANRDAFGRAKNGIPNRTVAAELLEGGGDIEVRWAATHGEQFHAKVLRIEGARRDLLFLGSANWTRRNLANLNLEANLLFEKSPGLTREFDRYFETLWTNGAGNLETVPYEDWAERGWSLRWKTWLYRFQEWSGASTF